MQNQYFFTPDGTLTSVDCSRACVVKDKKHACDSLSKLLSIFNVPNSEQIANTFEHFATKAYFTESFDTYTVNPFFRPIFHFFGTEKADVIVSYPQNGTSHAVEHDLSYHLSFGHSSYGDNRAISPKFKKIESSVITDLFLEGTNYAFYRSTPIGILLKSMWPLAYTECYRTIGPSNAPTTFFIEMKHDFCFLRIVFELNATTIKPFVI